MRYPSACRTAESVRRTALILPLMMLFGIGGGARPKDTGTPTPRHDTHKIQTLVDDVKARLSIREDVTVAIVPANARLVSVQRIENRADAFLLSLEQRFLDDLDDQELEAVVAHELGHVWIFTHHPYLHTEQLANRIAMRVVSRDALTTAYGKVQARGAPTPDIARVLDDEVVAVNTPEPESVSSN